MADTIIPNVVVSMPSQLFTQARSFKGNAGGKVYIGKIDTDPTIPENQVQVYLQTEDGNTIPVSQPVIINSGGYPVYNGQIAKFVTVEGHSMAVYDAYNVQQFYYPNVLKYDPDMLRQQLATDDGVSLVGSAADARELAGDEFDSETVVDHIHVRSDVSKSFRHFLNVKNGTVDATQALTDALTSGYTVEIPHDYILRLDSANIPTVSGTRLVGQYGARPTILINHTDIVSPQFNVTVFNQFANLRFRYPNQKLALAGGESPIAYGALFDGGGYFSEFHNLDVGNAYYAFKLGNATNSCSKITMSNIIGAPLFRGLSLDRVMDIPRVSDIHWNYNYMRDYALPGENYAYDDTLKTWIHNNGTAFHIGRCDFGTFFRLFSYGYWRGIYLRSERYTGSAENCRFISCDQDMSVHPLWLQNWENRVSILDCKLVGAVNSGMSRVDNTFNLISDTGQSTAVAVLDGVDIGYCNTNAVQTGANTIITNCKIHDYGNQPGSQGNAIIQSADRSVVVSDTTIDGAGGTKTRAIFTGVSTQPLTLGDGVSITNTTLASFDWRTGPVLLSRNARLGGSPGHNGISFISNVPKTYPCESIPTAGNYFRKGDYAEMTKPVIRSGGGVPDHVVQGWRRLTDANAAGTNHVLNTDWVEDRTYYRGL